MKTRSRAVARAGRSNLLFALDAGLGEDDDRDAARRRDASAFWYECGRLPGKASTSPAPRSCRSPATKMLTLPSRQVKNSRVPGRCGVPRHRRAGREVDHLHHLVGHRLGDEGADRHAAPLGAYRDVGRVPAPHLRARRREQLVDRHAERLRDLDQHASDGIACARFEVGDGRARHAGVARERVLRQAARWRRLTRLRARCAGERRSSFGGRHGRHCAPSSTFCQSVGHRAGVCAPALLS